MQNTFFQAICRMGIFMICAQALVHFRPKETYEKYLKLLVSVMVLIQIFLPIGNVLLGRGGVLAQRLDGIGRELERSMRDARESAAAADELLEKMTLEEVRSRLEAQEEERRKAASEEMPQEGLQEGAWQGTDSQGEGQGTLPEADWAGEDPASGNIEIDVIEPVTIDLKDGGEEASD